MQSSERSSLVSGPGLNSSPLGAKNPGVFTWFNNNLSLFSTPSLAFIVCRFFDDGHSDQCEMIPHSFDLQFSNNLWYWVSFYVLFGHLYVFFGKIVSLDLLPVFWLGCFIFLYWALWAICIFWRLISCQLFHLPIFSLIL